MEIGVAENILLYIEGPLRRAGPSDNPITPAARPVQGYRR